LPGGDDREGGAVGWAAELLSPSSRLTKRTRGVVVRPLHRDHVASRLVMPPLLKRKGVLDQSSTVPIALVWWIKSRPPTDEYFYLTGSCLPS
jgi:hypothetical protein